MASTTVPHTPQLLARLQAAEAEARDARRAIQYALDDLAAAHETLRQVRAELAAVLTDASVCGDASRPADPVPTAAEYIAAIGGGDPCGGRRRR